MTIEQWLPGVNVVDLSESHGYGPFQQPFLGVIMHVNQSNGNLVNFFRNSDDVCPNFQVYKTGAVEQYLPINNQPWCQTAGNQQYAAIETEGFNTEPWTDQQLASIGRILAFYNAQMDLTMQLAEAPGQRGVGWHGMGGVPWGNHPSCPGEPRKAQRQSAIDIATGLNPSGGGTPEDDMPLSNGDLYNIFYAPITDGAGNPMGTGLEIISAAVYARSVDASNAAILPSVQEGVIDGQHIEAKVDQLITAVAAIPGGSTPSAPQTLVVTLTGTATPEASA